MSDPKLGMHYEDARKKLKGRLGTDPQIKASILNQVKLHEGEGGKRELEKELSSANRYSPSFSGAGSKQIGVSDGYKLGDGRYKYDHGKWVKL